MTNYFITRAGGGEDAPYEQVRLLDEHSSLNMIKEALESIAQSFDLEITVLSPRLSALSHLSAAHRELLAARTSLTACGDLALAHQVAELGDLVQGRMAALSDEAGKDFEEIDEEPLGA